MGPAQISARTILILRPFASDFRGLRTVEDRAVRGFPDG